MGHIQEILPLNAKENKHGHTPGYIEVILGDGSTAVFEEQATNPPLQKRV